MEDESKHTHIEEHLQIGELAQRAGASIRMVRYYEEKGLLNPCCLTSGGIRLYNQQELNRLVFIRRLKTLGLNIEEIKMSLGSFQASPEQKVRVEGTLELLRLQKEKLQAEMTRLSEMAKEIDSSERLLTRCLDCQAPQCPLHCPSLAQVM